MRAFGYAVNDKVSLTGYVVNGWNDVKDNNDDKTFIGSVTVKPTAKLTVIGNYIVGKEQAADSGGGTRNLFDLVATFAASDKLSVLGNFDYGHDKSDRQRRGLERRRARAEVSGDPDVGLLAALRALHRQRRVRDAAPIRPCRKSPLTGEYKAPAGLLARIEFRTDFSDEEYFSKDDGDFTKNQPTLTVSLVYAFSNK